MRELMRPAAAALNLGRLLAVLSAVLAIAPYVYCIFHFFFSCYECSFMIVKTVSRYQIYV